MARPNKSRDAEHIDQPGHDIDHTALDEAGHALTTLGANVAAVEQEFGDDVMYNLEVYINAIRMKAAESAQRLIEIGRMLIIIREREPQGMFYAALEKIGLGVRFAQRAMQTAAKLHNLPRLQNLGVSKALELLSEDDDTLAELENGGTLAGLTIDELDAMSVRELKATLRAERKERDDEKATDEEIIRAKDERINKLTRDRRKGNDEDKLRRGAEDLLRDADEAVVEAQSQLARLLTIAGEVNQLYADAGLAVDADVEQRLQDNASWAQAKLAELAQVSGA